MYVFATIINCVLATSLVFVVYDNNIDNLVLRKNTIAEDIWECITGVSFLLFLLEATFIFFGGLAGMIELEQIKKFALTNVCLIVIVNGVLLTTINLSKFGQKIRLETKILKLMKKIDNTPRNIYNANEYFENQKQLKMLHQKYDNLIEKIHKKRKDEKL